MPELTQEEATAAGDRLAASGDHEVVAGLLRLHADRMRVVARERRLRRRFAAAHPGVRTATVPALPRDVLDLDGLRHVGEMLAAAPVS